MSSFFARVLLSCLVGLSAAGFLHSAFAAEGERSERSDVVETPEVFISSTKTEVPVKQVTSAVETSGLSKRWSWYAGGGAYAGRHTGTDARLNRRGDCQ
jgi:hypothetical protein